MIESEYGRQLREKGLNFGIVPGGTQMLTPPTKKEPGYWEKTEVTETRPGGGVVPLWGQDLKPIRLKKFSDNRPKYEAALKERDRKTKGDS